MRYLCYWYANVISVCKNTLKASSVYTKESSDDDDCDDDDDDCGDDDDCDDDDDNNNKDNYDDDDDSDASFIQNASAQLVSQEIRYRFKFNRIVQREFCFGRYSYCILL